MLINIKLMKYLNKPYQDTTTGLQRFVKKIYDKK